MSKSARLHPDGKTRCPWPGEDPFYIAYHDTEWGVPEYDDRALYEKLILDGFQAGLSWITILRKRENFRKAFDDFQPDKIARYNDKKIHALMNDVGIVRNRAKIEGTIASAKSWLAIQEQGPGFSALLWDFVGGQPKVNRFKTTASVPASSPLDIEIIDIAHGLARVARWNGQTSGTHIFSVAQHTLLVEAVMRVQSPRIDDRIRLAALLHDAPEYVIGDMISPFKAVLGDG